jgi:hypothetical protein
MKVLALLALGSLFVSCGGGGDSAGIPQADGCNQAAKTACTRLFACPEIAALAAGFPTLATEAQCETMVLSSCGTTGFECTAGETYHGDKAQRCKDQFSAQTCEQLDAALFAAVQSGQASTVIPMITMSIPACTEICTAAAD